jgi:hypothetical protein
MLGIWPRQFPHLTPLQEWCANRLESPMGVGVPERVLHPTGTLASVYYEYAVRLTSSDTEVSTMLGCAIAHEIGHLLLGPRSHSAGELCAQRAGRRRSAWR